MRRHHDAGFRCFGSREVPHVEFSDRLVEGAVGNGMDRMHAIDCRWGGACCVRTNTVDMEFDSEADH